MLFFAIRTVILIPIEFFSVSLNTIESPQFIMNRCVLNIEEY